MTSSLKFLLSALALSLTLAACGSSSSGSGSSSQADARRRPALQPVERERARSSGAPRTPLWAPPCSSTRTA